MVGAIEQVERDISALKAAVAAIAQETSSLYGSYLSVLGQAVRQQLIAASYHLCTHAYPEAFLQLSWSQRQQSQQVLQQLGQQGEQQVRSLLKLLQGATPHDPRDLIQVVEHLESAIVEELQAISQAANQSLQNYNILSGPAVEIALEVAAKAEAAGGTTTGPPNLLIALIDEEADPTQIATLDLTPEPLNPVSLEERPSSTGVRHRQRGSRRHRRDSEPEEVPFMSEKAIVAIYLRLEEIEFTDSTVMSWRNQIRKVTTQISGLQREFAKKQRERIIAEAQAAWRAGWFDRPQT